MNSVLYVVVIESLVFLHCAALPRVIKLGGLFDTEDKEQELAFRLAIEFFNRDKEGEPKPRFVPQVERLTPGDLYDAGARVCSLLEKGVAAIFGPQNHQTSLHVGSICDELEVPHVETRWSHRQKKEGHLSIDLHPDPETLTDYYVTMVKLMGWKNFTLVFDGKQGILLLEKFLKETDINGWQVDVYYLREGIPHRKVFMELKRKAKELKEEKLKIVLDVERKNLYSVLKEAQQVGMMTERQSYLITSLDLHTVDLYDFQFSQSNITGFRLVQENNSDYQRLIEEMTSPPYNYDHASKHGLKTETALMFDAVRMFILALQQLDLVKEMHYFPTISCKDGVAQGTDGTSIINYLKSTNMIGITGQITFNGQGKRTYFLLDVMYLQEDGLVQVGEMLSPQDINITKRIIDEPEFTNPIYNITTILTKPYIMLKNSSKDLHGNDRFEGYCVDVIQALSQHLNFRYNINLVRDKQFGNRLPNGKWTGMIGEVMNNISDMAVASLSINFQREQAVDFTMPFLNTGISILFKKPTTTVTSLFSFLSPFSTEVWIYLMGAYIGVSTMLFLVGRLTPYEWINPHPCRQDDIVVENWFNFRNSFWFNTGSLMQQGSELVPTASSTRIVASFWSLFTLILVSSYTANLAAFLTVEKVVYPFSNVVELAKQKKIKFGCLTSGTTRAFFEGSNIVMYKEMWKTMSKDWKNLVQDDDAGKKKVYEGDYAFFMESTTIRYLTERECQLTQVGALLDNKGYGIATRKGREKLSSWLSSGILSLQERGVLHTLRERWWKLKGGGKCLEKTQTPGKVRELGLRNVGGLFVVLIFGLGCSVLIAVIEFRWKSAHWENKNKESFWVRLKKEIKFSLQFHLTTKPVPLPRGSGGSSTTDESRSSSRGTNKT